MPRVKCSECGARIKVPENYRRSSIRCPECDHKVRLDDDDEPRATPRSKKSWASSSVLWVLPLLLLIPLAGCLFSAPFYHLGGVVGLIFSIIVCITSLIMVYSACKRHNLTTSDDMPFFVRNMPIVELFLQFKAAFTHPREVGTWVLIEMAALVVAIICGIIAKDPERYRRGGGDDKSPIAQGKEPGKSNLGEKSQPTPNEKKQPTPDDKPPPRTAAPPKITGDRQLDTHLDDLSSKDPRVRRQGAEGLTKWTGGFEHREVVAQSLVNLITKRPWDGSKEAMTALGKWASTRDVPGLIEFINKTDGNSLVWHESAIDILGNLRDERAAKPLAQYFGRAVNYIPAANALRKLGPAAEPEVLALLDAKRDRFYRARIANLLKDIGGEASIPSLKTLTNDQDEMVRKSAEEALSAISARTGRPADPPRRALLQVSFTVSGEPTPDKRRAEIVKALEALPEIDPGSVEVTPSAIRFRMAQKATFIAVRDEITKKLGYKVIQETSSAVN